VTAVTGHRMQDRGSFQTGAEISLFASTLSRIKCVTWTLFLGLKQSQHEANHFHLLPTSIICLRSMAPEHIILPSSGYYKKLSVCVSAQTDEQTRGAARHVQTWTVQEHDRERQERQRSDTAEET
jgi:hypothetical protein